MIFKLIVIAILFKQKVEGGDVYATDFCNDMLKYAAPKAEKLGLTLSVELADAMNLQFEDNEFGVLSDMWTFGGS